VGHAVKHLVDLLLYKPEGRGFDFLLNPCGRTMDLGSTLPLIEMSNMVISRGEVGCKDGLSVRLITMLLSCANCLEILEPSWPVRTFTTLAFFFLHLQSVFTSYEV
jgi:hypothetical protein